MKRLVVRYRIGDSKKEYCNLRADTIERDEGIVYAYIGEALVGIFDLGCIDMIYLSETKGIEE